MKIDKVLTDNGSPSSNRFTSKGKQASGQHAFDRQCVLLGIEHRLIQTAPCAHQRRVDRCNGRSDVLVSTRLRSREDLQSRLSVT